MNQQSAEHREGLIFHMSEEPRKKDGNLLTCVQKTILVFIKPKPCAEQQNTLHLKGHNKVDLFSGNEKQSGQCELQLTAWL